MSYCIIIFNDGRNDYLEKTLKSLQENVSFPEEPYKILYDDMPEGRDEEFLKAIKKKYKINKLILSPENLGINKSVQNAWAQLPKHIEYIYHQENDFTYNEPIDVMQMQKVLDMNHLIGQVALLRQPWYPDEIESGSLYIKNSVNYRPANIGGVDIVIQDVYFTHNPSLYRKKHAIKLENHHEWILADTLKKQHRIKYFAYLGGINDAPKVHHIGEIKKGVGDV